MIEALIAYWHIAHDGVEYRELSADWATRRHSPEHQTRRLVQQLEALGHQVQLTQVA
jgi:transposase